MRPALVATLLALFAFPPLLAQGQVIYVGGPAASNSFEALWSAFRKYEASGDGENARKVLDEVRRLRIERNIQSLEPLGMVFVARGLGQLEKGDRPRAEEEFQRAIIVDPHLPDAHFGLALCALKRGPLGFLPAVKAVTSAMTARLPTLRGRYYVDTLLIAVSLLALFVATVVFAFVVMLRYGKLLLHDLEESLGSGRARLLALGLWGMLLFLPLIGLQGFGWLPLWWLALLFIYASRLEQAVALALLLLAVAVGPVADVLQSRVLAMRNPLLRASVLAIEGGSDARAIAELEAALRKSPDDRDLSYLLAIQKKKNGQYDEAAALYREILRRDEKDPIALNNLGNIEFARQEFPAAITRYKLARRWAESGVAPEVTATIYYNLSLAHLQKFERQDADEARAQADRLAAGLTHSYEKLWKYETRNENAVVDLGLTPEQVWAKFVGRREGVGRKSLAGRTVGSIDSGALPGAVLNRFLGFMGVFALVLFAMRRWRGPKMFTMRCLKCGTPFCKRCHLGAAPAGLCTQCFHLFVVRDGVSGPARNQKLLEVQKEDERRERIFRALSLLSPGAGHLYAQKTLLGMLFVVVWYLLLSLALLAGRLLPVTEAPLILAGRWMLALPAALLLMAYVAANRARPDFDVTLPVARGPRRGRAA